MSQINVNQIVDASGGVLAPISSVMRNRIINGAMVISQRSGTSSITPTDGQYTLDRWKAQLSQASKFTVQQDAGAVTPPVGFTDYLGVTSTSAYSSVSGDYFFLVQAIEGFNTADLNWGTANAATVTLSFWVRSSLTGTFGGSLRNSAGNRSYPFTYTVSAANTWEQKSVTIAGDTTGTWEVNNNTGISVSYNLGSGSTFTATGGAWAAGNFVNATGATSVVGTSGATFYITGVQLEKGTQATSFEYRQIGTELALCQRYCNVIRPNVSANGLFSGLWFTTTGTLNTYSFPVQMRSAPTLTISAAGDFTVVGNNTADSASVVSASGVGVAGCRMDVTSSVSRTAGQGCLIQTANTSSTLNFSAEL